MAKELRAYVVLEGIETADLLRFAAETVERAGMWGQVAVQGYLLGRPGAGRIDPMAHGDYRDLIRSALAAPLLSSGAPVVAG